MAWMIVRIEPRDNDVKPEGQQEPVVAHLRQRVDIKRTPADVILHERAPALAKKHGYELDPFPRSGRKHSEWPYITYVYTSPNKEGRGRGGSTLYRWPARRIA